MHRFPSGAWPQPPVRGEGAPSAGGPATGRGAFHSSALSTGAFQGNTAAAAAPASPFASTLSEATQRKIREMQLVRAFHAASCAEITKYMRQGFERERAIDLLVESMRSKSEGFTAAQQREMDELIAAGSLSAGEARRVLVLRNEIATLKRQGHTNKTAIECLIARMRRVVGQKRRRRSASDDEGEMGADGWAGPAAACSATTSSTFSHSHAASSTASSLTALSSPASTTTSSASSALSSAASTTSASPASPLSRASAMARPGRTPSAMTARPFASSSAQPTTPSCTESAPSPSPFSLSSFPSARSPLSSSRSRPPSDMPSPSSPRSRPHFSLAPLPSMGHAPSLPCEMHYLEAGGQPAPAPPSPFSSLGSAAISPLHERMFSAVPHPEGTPGGGKVFGAHRSKRQKVHHERDPWAEPSEMGGRERRMFDGASPPRSSSSSSSSASSSSSSFSSSFSSSSSSSPSSRAQRSPPSPSSPPSSSGTASSTGSPDAQLERLTVAMVRLGMKRRTWSDEHAAGGEDSTAQHQSKRRCAHAPHELGSPGSGSDSSAW